MTKPKLTTYGHGGTIHGTNHVDVETDAEGNVVAVWFRCCAIPFEQMKHNKYSNNRVQAMKNLYKNKQAPKLHAIVIEDKNG
jgi:hypothetical protein